MIINYDKNIFVGITFMANMGIGYILDNLCFMI
jgi:hypothetical protein